MEKILQYVWKHRLWSSEDMLTNDGRKVRVIDPGLLNTDQGPDFFNAKVEIDGNMWVGNVEIHVRATDWQRHGHNNDKAYDSVILHVVQKDDAPVYRTNGERIPQVVLDCSPRFGERLNDLLNARTEIPCSPSIPTLPRLLITEWIQALAFERLHSKVGRIRDLYDATCGNWEEVCYVTLSRNLGFGVNNDAMERLARRTPLRLLHKHSDSLFQIEALLYGQAGMLSSATENNPKSTSGSTTVPGTSSTATVPEASPSGNKVAILDPYTQQLTREYAFLANKFSLTPIEGEAWKCFRMRPHNFPSRRIALLAHYIEGGFNLMQAILEAPDEKALRQLFSVELTGYWSTHYALGKESNMTTRALGEASIDIILINTVAPLYYAYGEITGNYDHIDRAIALLESLRPEKNSIVASFAMAGLKSDDALTTQALIQLKHEYCDARKCMYCKIGHRLLATAARTK